MNSVKNLLVCVMLMGVSYGAYQVITTPDPALETDPDADVLDIQIGSRLDSDQMPAPPLRNESVESYNESPQSIPPLPNEFSGSTTLSQSQVSPPELTMPELKMPELHDTPPAQPSADRDTFAVDEETSPPIHTPQTGNSGFSPPTLTPPPVASKDPIAFQAPLNNQSTDNGTFAPDNDTFNATPETKLTDVTPKPATGDSSGFVAQNNDSTGSTGGSFAGSGNRTTESTPWATETSNQGFQPYESSEPELENNSSEFIASTTPASDTNSAAAGPDTRTSFPPMDPKPAYATVDWQGINELASVGNAREALAKLSEHYNDNLPQDQRMQMLSWLDILAGKVIYSTEHQLNSQPHVVTQNETLEMIAQAWNVPAQLIYNVNQSKIGDPAMLVPGTELKVIPGPFNAIVNLERQELTLFLNGMYAGRFPIELGHDGPGITHGSFMVEQKLRGRDYTGSDGQVIAAAATENPYGKYWIGLNGELSIHESNPSQGQQDNRGSIRLGSRDAADVFGILSNGSQVTITR